MKALLDAGHFNVSILTRSDSGATFPDGVTVKKGDYSSSSFLESALKGQEVLVITLNALAPQETQSALIKAAANAGVPWVIPNEYSQDGSNEKLVEIVPVLAFKKQHRDEIQSLGVSNWIAVTTNPWFDFVRVLSHRLVFPIILVFPVQNSFISRA